MQSTSADSAAIVLRETNTLLTLPEICLRLREVLADPVHSRRQVAEVLRFDPALVTRLLRIVNSAYYALPYRVDSLEQALGIVGERELQTLVMVTSIVKNSTALEDRMNIREYWQRSVLSALIARELCGSKTHAVREEYFLCGLLLNVGKLPLYSKEPTLLAAVDYEMQQRGIDELGAERSLTGTDHSQVGNLLLSHWQFPERLCAMVAYHHVPANAKQLLDGQLCMNLAAWFSDCFSSPDSYAPAAVIAECPHEYGSLCESADELLALLGRCQESLQEVYETFCSARHWGEQPGSP